MEALMARHSVASLSSQLLKIKLRLFTIQMEWKLPFDWLTKSRVTIPSTAGVTRRQTAQKSFLCLKEAHTGAFLNFTSFARSVFLSTFHAVIHDAALNKQVISISRI